MQETPDLSKIISVIMQNPALVSEIASLATSSKVTEAKEESAPIVTADPTASEVRIAESEPQRTNAKTHRRELLNAMKPYLSETRRGALDSMSSILDIIDVMVRKES